MFIEWIVHGEAMWYESRLSGSCGFVRERRWSRLTQVQCCGHKQLGLVFTGKPNLISLEWPQKCPIRKLWHHRTRSVWPLLWISQMVYSLFHRYGLVAGLKSSCMPVGQTYSSAQYSIQQTGDSFVYERLRFVNKLYEIEVISNSFAEFITSLIWGGVYIYITAQVYSSRVVPNHYCYWAFWVHFGGVSGPINTSRTMRIEI